MLRLAFVVVLVVAAAPAAVLALPSGPSGAPRPMAAPLDPTATFPLADPFDYSDVVLLGNNNSATSRNLTAHFQSVRGVPSNNVFLADLPVAETISPAQWATFAAWFTGEMANRSLGAEINYIVTFKGMPIRVSWANANGPTSFQDELMLLGGPYASYIGNAGSAGYNNPYFNQTARFSFRQFGLRLVTGIYAYNESTAMALIDRSVNSLGSRGEFVLDADSSKGMAGAWGGYAYANQALVWANASLTAAGQPVYLDTNTTYVTGRTGVMGYSSWGSNDCCWGSVTQVAKPQNTWVNGSIGETFVSTGGRTFTWPPSYGQSLIADWIDEGANGMKGYTDEPYIHSIADGHILHPRYVAGYNLAESFWAASHVIGWRQIVIGDPKMAPFANIGNMSVNATLTAVPSDVLQFGALNVTVGLDNTAALEKAVTVRFQLGNVTIADASLRAPGHAAATFDVPLDLASLDPSLWGPVNLTVTIDPDNAFQESNENDNVAVRPVDIRRLPIATGSFDASVVLTSDTIVLHLGVSRADRPIDHFDVEINGSVPTRVAAVADGASIALQSARSTVLSFNVTAVDSAGVRSPVLGPLVATVLNRPPIAILEANVTQTQTLLPVQFTATPSMDAEGAIAEYRWDAGPGGNGTGIGFSASFARAGNYVVTLTVIDDEGAANSTSVSVNVTNRAPLVALAANATSLLTAVFFNFSAAASIDLDGSIVQYTFSFDDGTRVVGSLAWVLHEFAVPGPHTASVEITDDLGARATAGLSVTAENRLPSLQLIAATNAFGKIVEALPVAFALAMFDRDGNLSACTIDFGDGSRSTQYFASSAAAVTFHHTYRSEGAFTVRATVNDEFGGAASASLQINVEHPAPTVSSPHVSIDGANLSVSYSAQSPYDSLELLVIIDGITWRSPAAERNGSVVFRLPDLPPGNHSVEVVISDGVLTERVGTVTYEVEEPPAPPTGGGTTNPSPGLPWVLFGAVAAVAALVVVGALIWRKRRAERKSPSQDEQAAQR